MKAQIRKDRTPLLKALMVLAVALAVLAAPFGTGAAYAKSLKACGVKTTKAGQVVNSKLWYAGAGKQNCTCSIKYIKVKKAKKAGYKTATVMFEVKEKWNPNNRQIMAMADRLDDDGNIIDGNTWAFIVDGKTGANLEADSVGEKYDVTYKTSGWKYYNWWRHTATDGSWVELPKTSRIKYVITYPNSYKSLYVGIGVGQRRYSDAAMRKFESGRVTYGSCWWHKKNKSSTFFVRVK